jgi:hypothetical protein
MTRRLVIQAGSGSPFRVASLTAGDAATASQFDTVFDGNQSPLRYLTKGYMYCQGIPYGNTTEAWVTQGDAPVYSAPPGQFPLFSLMEYRIGSSPNPNSGRTIWKATTGANQGGFGGTLANGFFYGINFSRQVRISNPGQDPFITPLPYTYICYLIFKNYG